MLAQTTAKKIKIFSFPKETALKVNSKSKSTTEELRRTISGFSRKYKRLKIKEQGEWNQFGQEEPQTNVFSKRYFHCVKEQIIKGIK